MYEPGHLLELTAEPSRNTIVVRIHAIPHKFTLSATLVVDIVSAHESLGLPARAFLKLNDSRTAHEYRWRHQLGDYTPEIHAELLRFSRKGKLPSFLAGYHSPDRPDTAWPAYTAAEKEVALKEDLADELKFELDAYDALNAHQGVSIPKLYSRVSYMPGKPDDGAKKKKKKEKKPKLGRSPELFRVPGLLMQHIDGFRLTDMPFHVGDLPGGRDRNARWCAIVEQARAKVAAVFGGAADVLNRDTRPENVMVVVEDQPPPADGGEPGYRIFLVDLGCCQRRPGDMSDRDWREMKRDQAEADRMKRLALEHLRPFL